MTKKELADEVAALRAEVAALRADLAYRSQPVIVPQPYPVPYYPQSDWWRPTTLPIITCSSDIANTDSTGRYIGSAS